MTDQFSCGISLERSYITNSKYIKPSVMRGLKRATNLEYSNGNEAFENSLEMPHH